MRDKILIAATIMMLGIFSSCQHKRTTAMPNTKTHAFRLKPGADLKRSIQAFVAENKLSAAWIATCVGSLTNYNIRLANQPAASTGEGHFEIVSLTGTLSINGSHMHIGISDSTGKTIGGHLMEGCMVYTTAEIVLQSNDQLVFKREKDGSRPWEELNVEEKK